VDIKLGTVLFFNNKHGWGLIDYNGQPIFIHHSAINSKKRYKSLKKDAIVQFEIESSQSKFPKAVNVNEINAKHPIDRHAANRTEIQSNS